MRKSPILWTFDQEKMEWILTNLLSNALKFSFEGGKIQVSVKRTSDNHLSIAVRDYGAGINPNDLPHILDRFYRGVSENTDIGSGIGLSILQELVQLHHGTVNVESELQKGSCFTILLPHLDVRVEKTPSRTRTTLGVKEPVSPPLKLDISSPAESSSNVAPPRDVILIAEDNVDLLAFIRESLQDSFDVIVGENGRMALEECSKQVPDLVITDVMMPEMNGMDLCKHLKSDLATSHIPVIMLTASADTETMTSGLQTGADVYLTKPFETPRLMAYIDSLLENRRRIRAAYSSEISRPVALGHSEEPTVEEENLSLDGRFVARLHLLIHEQLSDSDFKVESLADQMNLSSRQFLRKVEALTGEIPSILLRRIRLE